MFTILLRIEQPFKRKQYWLYITSQQNFDKPKDFNLTLDYISLRDTMWCNTYYELAINPISLFNYCNHSTIQTLEQTYPGPRDIPTYSYILWILGTYKLIELIPRNWLLLRTQ